MNRFEFLNQMHPLANEDYQLLTSNMTLKKFKKGADCISPGQVQRDLYFIKSGVQMGYVENAGKKHIVEFTYHPNICFIPDSFPNQKPSSYYFTCITDSEIECITYLDLQRLFEKSRSIETLFRKITETILARQINRQIELRTTSIEERYKAFCARSPHLLQRVPHKYIAAYLEIDATNFSKLYNSVKI